MFSSSQSRTSDQDAISQSSGGYFSQFALQGNPFDLTVEEDENEDVMVTNGVSGGSPKHLLASKIRD